MASKDGPGLVWEGADIPRISPGDYQAVCIGWHGPQWCRAFHRWSLRLEFALAEGGTLISQFFNMGADPLKPQTPGRRSRFYAAWCLANGRGNTLPCGGGRTDGRYCDRAN